MTSQKDQIQALIVEIDGVLQKANSRLPWVMSGEIAQQRQVLERVRNYLVVLQQQLPVDGLRRAEVVSPMGYPPEFYPSGATASGASAVDAQQMMQTILQEMSYLRASVMQPMQADLENLRQRRELLTQELSHLEAERQNQTLAQRAADRSPNPQQFTDELVQVLMSRLQESLSQQIGQALRTQAQTLAYGATFSRPGESLPGALVNSQYEQLQALRSRSDQMLVNLDSTLNIVFESLQRNVQAYQASLTQGLERMYSLGQQSEVAFKALMSELAQQLNQEASAYLISLAQGQAADPKTANPVPKESLNPLPKSRVSEVGESAPSPHPSSSDEEKSLPPMPELDAALESWLRSADSSNFDPTELISSALDLGTRSNDSASPQTEVFPYFSDGAIFGESPAESFASDSRVANTAELDEALKLLEELDSESQDSRPAIPSAVIPSIQNSPVEQDEFYQSLFGDITPQRDQNDPDAIASLSNLSNDFLPEATNSNAPLDTELDNIDQAAIPADLTFESIGTDLELPELFAEGVAETETISITELPARLFDDISTAASSLEPFPLTVETESLLTDLEPSSSESDGVGSFADLFQALSLESAQSNPANPPAIAGDWASLQAAAPLVDPLQSVQTDPLGIGFPDSEFALEGREDQFTRAALDENLLPDAIYEGSHLSLDLDDSTFDSLSEDLSNVETPIARQSDRVTEDRPLDDFPSLDEFALFLEDSSPQTEQPFDQSMGDRADLTIEEFGTLFDDAPNISPQISPPPTAGSRLPKVSPQETQKPAELPSLSAIQLPPPQVADDGSLPFTLEGMDDLFEDAPDLVPLPPASAPQPNRPDSSSPSSKVQNFLGASPNPPPPTVDSLPLTLEGMDDLFGDAPLVQAPSAPTHPKILEKPPSKTDHGRSLTEEASPLTPEPPNELSIDAPPLSLPLPEESLQKNKNTSDTPTAVSLSDNPPDTPINLGLDEAFESLLGKSISSQPSTLKEKAKEKKKTL